jgi:hypothetical protein
VKGEKTKKRKIGRNKEKRQKTKGKFKLNDQRMQNDLNYINKKGDMRSKFGASREWDKYRFLQGGGGFGLMYT